MWAVTSMSGAGPPLDVIVGSIPIDSRWWRWLARGGAGQRVVGEE